MVLGHLGQSSFQFCQEPKMVLEVAGVAVTISDSDGVHRLA